MTPEQIQAELDAAVVALAKTTSSYHQMVSKYGADFTRWPKTSSWYIGLTHIANARAAVSGLTTKVLTAAFEEVVS